MNNITNMLQCYKWNNATSLQCHTCMQKFPLNSYQISCPTHMQQMKQPTTNTPTKAHIEPITYKQPKSYNESYDTMPKLAQVART